MCLKMIRTHFNKSDKKVSHKSIYALLWQKWPLFNIHFNCQYVRITIQGK